MGDFLTPNSTHIHSTVYSQRLSSPCSFPSHLPPSSSPPPTRSLSTYSNTRIPLRPRHPVSLYLSSSSPLTRQEPLALWLPIPQSLLVREVSNSFAERSMEAERFPVVRKLLTDVSPLLLPFFTFSLDILLSSFPLIYLLFFSPLFS